MTEYPKQLYRKGWGDLTDTIVVNSQDEEDAVRVEGFKMLGEEAEGEGEAKAEAPKRGRNPKAE